MPEAGRRNAHCAMSISAKWELNAIAALWAVTSVLSGTLIRVVNRARLASVASTLPLAGAGSKDSNRSKTVFVVRTTSRAR